jgi:hypothetical protein
MSSAGQVLWQRCGARRRTTAQTKSEACTEEGSKAKANLNEGQEGRREAQWSEEEGKDTGKEATEEEEDRFFG